MPSSLSPRTLRALAAFGITVAEARNSFHTTVEPGARNAAACALRIIRHGAAPILFAGPSGAGKSTAMKLVQRALKRRGTRCAHVRIQHAHRHQRRRNSRNSRTAIDLFRAPLPITLAKLARAGLSDATLLARPVKHFSEGQKWRLELALADHRAERTHAKRKRSAVIADEFCAALDLATASAITASAAAHRAAPLIAATSREDLIDHIRADPRWTVIDIHPHDRTQGDPCTSVSTSTSKSRRRHPRTTRSSRTSTTAPGRRRRQTASSAPRAARKQSPSSPSRAPRSMPAGANRSGPSPSGRIPSGPASSPILHPPHARASSTRTSAPSPASSSIRATAASASPRASSAPTSTTPSPRTPRQLLRWAGSAVSSAQPACEKSFSNLHAAIDNCAAPSALQSSSPGVSLMPTKFSVSPPAPASRSKLRSGAGRTTPARRETSPKPNSETLSTPLPEPSPIHSRSEPTGTTPNTPPTNELALIPPPLFSPASDESGAILSLLQPSPKAALEIARKAAPDPAPDPAPAHTIELDPLSPPKTPAELAALLRNVFNLAIPAGPPNDTHTDGPLDYLAHSFFEGRRFAHADLALDTHDPADCVVWANRGGGKTFLGAVATMLDLVFKPGIQVRILGGSLEQSKRMQDHLTRLFEHERLAPLLKPGRAGRAARSVTLANGSRAEVLAASETSVRGVRVQKVRCDEVELFTPPLWRAVQLTTRSLNVSGPWGPTVRGSIEALSTMHLPYGIMWDLVGAGIGGSGELPAAAPKRRLFRWGLIDALEHCTSEHACDTCNLFDDCRGRAKVVAPTHGGHIAVADAQAQKRRVDIETWRSEMLCLEPRKHDLVYPEFDPRIHVVGLARDDSPLGGSAFGGPVLGGPALRAGSSLSSCLSSLDDSSLRAGSSLSSCLSSLDDSSLRAGSSPSLGGSALRAELSASSDSTLHAESSPDAPDDSETTWIAGMDFGFRAETAILLARVNPDGTVIVEHERIAKQRVLDRHIEALDSLMATRGGLRSLKWLAADPAGNSRNDQTGEANIALLRAAGIRAKSRGLEIADGLKHVRARLAPASGPARLFIHARCTRLIESLRRYHFKPDDGRSQVPAKGEFDHACDALRYMIAMLDVRHETKLSSW